MIIEQLVLHDFGVFRGRHEIDLAPSSSEKPVILIGALNGRGKTTALDAINLVLFGQRARLSNRRPKDSWDKYLRESINHRASGGALVGMRFSVDDVFGTRHYEIARSWEVVGKSVKEFFSVSVNGETDHVLADDWDEHIEGLLPLEVASLNFFDGEKIDKLADPSQSRSVLESAIRGLLGLGVLERLQADLKVYLRRKQSEAIGDEVPPEITGIEAEMEMLTSRAEALKQEMGGLTNKFETARMEISRIEADARAIGSDKWEQRAELENNYRELVSLRATLESELQSVAEGAAPLRLVFDLLGRTEQQMASDDRVHLAVILLGELERRDSAVLASLPTDAADLLRPLLEKDRRERSVLADSATVHDSTSEMRTFVSAAIRESQDIATGQVLADLGALDGRIVDVERKLMAVPSGDQLAPVLEELGRARAEANAVATQRDSVDLELEHIATALSRLEMNKSRIITALADEQRGAIEDKRSREYAAKALDTVGELMRSTVLRNLTKIECAVLERFHQLIGKSGLVTGVEIDPETLELSVRGAEGSVFPVERLSAGERQLLATSILWGLSTVAGRSIPLVIDTPLGRLDGDHRTNLIDHYFPHASPQVVILSTDTEFTPERYERMRHAIGREYTIEYDAGERASFFRPGYLEGDDDANQDDSDC